MAALIHFQLLCNPSTEFDETRHVASPNLLLTGWWYFFLICQRKWLMVQYYEARWKALLAFCCIIYGDCGKDEFCLLFVLLMPMIWQQLSLPFVCLLFLIFKYCKPIVVHMLQSHLYKFIWGNSFCCLTLKLWEKKHSHFCLIQTLPLLAWLICFTNTSCFLITAEVRVGLLVDRVWIWCELPKS